MGREDGKGVFKWEKAGGGGEGPKATFEEMGRDENGDVTLFAPAAWSASQRSKVKGRLAAALIGTSVRATSTSCVLSAFLRCLEPGIEHGKGCRSEQRHGGYPVGAHNWFGPVAGCCRYSLTPQHTSHLRLHGHCSPLGEVPSKKVALGIVKTPQKFPHLSGFTRKDVRRGCNNCDIFGSSCLTMIISPCPNLVTLCCVIPYR